MPRILILFLFLLASLQLMAQDSYEAKLKAMKSEVVEVRDGRSFYIHTIKKGQTLYSISKAYGVDANDILSENPELKEGLKAEHKIRIPFTVAVKNEPKKSSPADGKPLAPSSGEYNKASADTMMSPAVECGKDIPAAGRTCKVVLMLPLYLQEVESLNPESASREDIENWNPLKFIQFYEGFMISADSLKKKGLHLELYVFDVGKDTLRTLQLLKKPEIRTADLIIGLLYHRNFMIVADFAKQNKIQLVNPVSDRNDIIRENKMVFKTSPSAVSRMEILADVIALKLYRGQIVIVRNPQFKEKELADKLRKECQDRRLNAVIAETQESAISQLSKSRENVIVALTDNNVYALDLMRRFYELRNDYSITLVGLPDWTRIEGLETDFLNGLNTYELSRFFVDYSDKGVKTFVRSFQSAYKTDPDQLAFHGFDTGYYFLSALMKFGKDLPACISAFRLRTAHTDFQFIQSGENGFENRHWAVFRYENLKLVSVN